MVCEPARLGYLWQMTSGYSGDDTDPRQTTPPASDTQADRSHVPKTRTGAAWVGACLAAVIAIALVVFLAQNTDRVHVSFLWMDVNTPLALALLVAALAAALLTLVIGSARILQLRRRVHQQGPPSR